jgi:ubiquinone/menaquinone biosynthesis C-methylase UbiE
MAEIEKQMSKEDVASEAEYFDKYYREHRGQPDPLEPIWVAKALHPSPRPLDYWEYTFYLIGDLNGKTALEVGCGAGWMTRMLALKGALVSAIDVSEEGCASTKLKLQSNGLSFDTICVMDAHAMTFSDESFDLVVMAGVLHHVNLFKALSEIRRVLKPGGRFVCYEPLQYGPIMRFLKDIWLKVNGLQDYNTTKHEEALSDKHLAPLRKVFAKGSIRKFNFLAKTNRLKNRFGMTGQLLRWADYILLSAIPPLRRYCTCVVCCFEK